MHTNEIISNKVKAWLERENKSYQWLADQLDVSKSLVGHMLSGERKITSERIVQLAKLMNSSIEELLYHKSKNEGPLTVQLRGRTSTRKSKRELESLLFAIEDYVGLQEQLGR